MTAQGGYLTIPEVAEVMRCTDETVRRRIKDGRIPAIFEANRYLVDRRALDSYLESKTVRARPVSLARRRRKSG